MKDDFVLIARPNPFDILLVVIGPVILAAAPYIFFGEQLYLVQGFVVGCILAVLAWRWPRIMGIVLLVLSTLALAYSLILVLYSGGMPNWLVSLWGSVAFLVGAVGVLRWRSAAQRPMRHIAVQAGWVGSLACSILTLLCDIVAPPRQSDSHPPANCETGNCTSGPVRASRFLVCVLGT